MQVISTGGKQVVFSEGYMLPVGATAQSIEADADRAEQAASNAAASAAFVDDAMGLNLKPIIVLFLGQSNMRGNPQATGGDLSMVPNVHVWDNFIPTTYPGTMRQGTAWTDFAMGKYPMDVMSGGNYASVMPQAIMRHIGLRLRRPVYGITVACGGHSIESFLKPSTRSSNGWALPSGEFDLSTQLYPQLANAIAQVPMNRGVFDAVFLHQGEKNFNTGDTPPSYRAKVAALFSDLVGEGVANGVLTSFVAGAISDSNVRYFNQLGAISNNLPGAIPTLKVADSRGLVTTDGVHFNANGINAFGFRMVNAWQSPLDQVVIDSIVPFSPEIAGSASGGAVASGNISGVARRVGRYVTVSVQAASINTTGLSAGSEIHIRGLPFPIAEYATSSVNLGFTAFTGSPTVTGEPGNSHVRIFDVRPSAGISVLNVGSLTSGTSSIRFSFTYATNY